MMSCSNPSNPGPSPRIKAYLPGLCVFCFAAVIRLVYLVQIKDTDAFYLPMGDGEVFDLWAQEIAGGDWLGSGVFFQAPLYPYFLGAVYAVAGRDLFLVRAIQIGIGSLSCVWVMAAGNLFFSKRVGFIAGLLLCVYPAAIFFDCQIQKTVLGFFFMALLIFLLGKQTVDRWPPVTVEAAHSKKGHGSVRPADQIGQERTLRDRFRETLPWAAVGAVLGLLALVRENAMILLPVVLFWIWVFFRKEKRRTRAYRVLGVVVGTLLILLPVAARNKAVGNVFTLTTSNFGFNLYIGNNAQSTGTYRSLVSGRGDWRYEQKDAAELAQKAVGGPLTPGEVSSYWTKKALAAIAANPLDWAELVLKKWAMTWNAVDLSDTESIYAHFDWSGLLKSLSFFDFGWGVTLAAFGVYATWPLRSRLWPLYMTVLVYAAGICLFFVFSRFRHPMAAIVIPFAAAGLEQAVLLFRRKDFLALLAGVAVAAVAAVATRVPIVQKEDMAATTYYNLGVSLQQRADEEKAISYYQKSLALNPGHAMAHNNIGILLFQKGKTREAIRHFEEALRFNPDFADPHHSLGLAYSRMARWREALEHFERTVAVDPGYNPVVYYNIACILARLNQPEASVQWLRDAVEHGYGNCEQMKTDADLSSIRDLPEFERWFASVCPP